MRRTELPLISHIHAALVQQPLAAVRWAIQRLVFPPREGSQP
jgi:hypothetical protein